MRMPRFQVRTLMIAVAGVAASFGVLRAASTLWSQVVFAVVLATLGSAILGIIYRRGAQRAWWVGFALFGWGDFLVENGPWLRHNVAIHMPTASLLTEVYRWLAPVPDADAYRAIIETKESLENIDSLPVRSQIKMDQTDVLRSAIGFVEHLDPKDREIITSHLSAIPAEEVAEAKERIARTRLPKWSGHPPWGQLEEFVAIGKSLGVVLAGCVGGLVAHALSGIRSEQADVPSSLPRDIGD